MYIVKILENSVFTALFEEGLELREQFQSRTSVQQQQMKLS